MKNASATAPNLKRFMDLGGKLIVEHGWSDGTTIPMQTVQYFEQIGSTMGQKAVDSFVRLYMVPGMAHSGGTGLPGAVTGPLDQLCGAAAVGRGTRSARTSRCEDRQAHASAVSVSSDGCVPGSRQR
jgi:hypothetical protein